MRSGRSWVKMRLGYSVSLMHSWSSHNGKGLFFGHRITKVLSRMVWNIDVVTEVMRPHVFGKLEHAPCKPADNAPGKSNREH